MVGRNIDTHSPDVRIVVSGNAPNGVEEIQNKIIVVAVCDNAGDTRRNKSIWSLRHKDLV
jgi:hypothetical protein